MRKGLLFILILFFAFTAKAQDLYLLRSGGNLNTININGCVTQAVSHNSISLTDIAFAPDGKLYGISGSRNIYELDETSGAATLITNIDNSGRYVALTCDADYNLIAADDEGDIFTYNINTMVIEDLGNCGFIAGGDLGFANGNLYLGGTQGLILIDLADVTNSSLQIPWTNSGSIWGMFTDADDCGNSTMYVFDNQTQCKVYTADFVNRTLSTYCVINGRYFGGASKNAFNASEPFGIDNVNIETQNCIPTGQVEIIHSSGTAPFMYSIDGGATPQNSPIFTGLIVGQYQAWIEDDNGCENVFPFEITAAGLTISPTVLGAKCGLPNGIANFNPTGGNAPIQYSLDGGQTYQDNPVFMNLAAGSYNGVALDASGCEIAQQINVNSLASPLEITSYNVFNATCDEPGGIENIEFTGGLGAISYLLNGAEVFLPDLKLLPPGNYELEVEDDLDCSDTISFKVENVSDESFVDEIEITPAFCDETDGSISILPLAGANLSLSQDGINYSSILTVENLAPAIYSIFIKNNDTACIETQDVEVSSACGIYVPTAISPNGNGENDRLAVLSPREVTIEQYQVFNRWGQLVYSQDNFVSNNLDLFWDGRLSDGSILPGGYIYNIVANQASQQFEFKGVVTILK